MTAVAVCVPQKKKVSFLGSPVEVNICGVPRPTLFQPNLAAHQRDDVSSTKDHLQRFKEQKVHAVFGLRGQCSGSGIVLQ